MWFKAGKSSKSEVKTRWNSIKPSKTHYGGDAGVARDSTSTTSRTRRRNWKRPVDRLRKAAPFLLLLLFFFASCLSFVFFFPFLFFSFLFVFFSLPFFLGSKDGRRIVGCPFSFQSIRSVAQSRFTEFYRVLPSFTELFCFISFLFFLETAIARQGHKKTNESRKPLPSGSKTR